MSQMVTCPHCQSLLRSQQTIRAGANLRCPDCSGAFAAPHLETVVAKTNVFGARFFLAVAAAVVVGASLITGVVLFTARTPVARAEEAPVSDPLAEQKKALADAQTALAEKERQFERKLEHARLLRRAEDLLDRGKHAEAKNLFTRALKLRPGDPDTVQGLAAAEAGLQAAARTGAEEKKRQEQVATLVADARTALAEKKYTVALQRLEAARTVAPLDRTVLDLLAQAQSGLDGDRAEKKKRADFQVHMDAAAAAMKAERYADAVKEYLAALRLMPDDLEAQNGQKRAEARIANLADREKRQKAFAALADRGRAALAGRRFKEAIQTLEAALRQIPDDRDAKRDLTEAKTALARVKKENASLRARASEAAEAGRLVDARRLLTEAVNNWAEDDRAEKALRNVERLLKNVETAQATVRAANLARLEAALALYNAGNYAAAVTAYLELSRLLPNDLEVARYLLLARRALARRAEFDRQMRAGNAALAARAWADAIRSFNNALRADPDNPLAIAGLNKARYNKAVLDGQQALVQRRKKDAIDAFNIALDAKPGDPLASAGLRRAQMMR